MMSGMWWGCVTIHRCGITYTPALILDVRGGFVHVEELERALRARGLLHAEVDLGEPALAELAPDAEEVLDITHHKLVEPHLGREQFVKLEKGECPDARMPSSRTILRGRR